MLLEFSAGLPVYAKKDLIIIQVGIGGGVEGLVGGGRKGDSIRHRQSVTTD